MKMKEYKIGETFLIGRKKFQVVECNGLCEGCYYKQREDAKNVCFKLVEK